MSTLKRNLDLENINVITGQHHGVQLYQTLPFLMLKALEVANLDFDSEFLIFQVRCHYKKRILSNLTLFKGRGNVIDDVAEMSCVPTNSTWENIFHVFAERFVFENLFGYVQYQ